MQRFGLSSWQPGALHQQAIRTAVNPLTRPRIPIAFSDRSNRPVDRDARPRASGQPGEDLDLVNRQLVIL